MTNRLLAALLATVLVTPACAQSSDAKSEKQMQRQAQSPALTEMMALQATAARESGRAAYSPGNGVKFKASDNVFVKSVLAIDFTYRAANATLPLYRGRAPGGADVFYIITDASDFEVARQMGINYAPKMSKAAGTSGAQAVTLANGVMQFRGNVDFAPVYEVTPGPAPTYFPPKSFKPGAVGDAEWSSMAVLPSGTVLNVQMVHNSSGRHDRLTAIDLKARTATMSLLDGVHAGKQYYYHLVTDVSADLPAVLEKGVFTPRLAKVPAFGKSLPGDNSALLGFSPVLNGTTVKGSGQDQGFSTSLANGGIDPINVFPIPPRNNDKSINNNYSPLWDAHVAMWTPAAIKAGKVKRIHSLGELEGLIKAGLITNAMINPPGAGNPFIGGLRSTQAIINCPVIAQPDLPRR